MINEFLAFIDRQKLFNRKHKILLAVSGGVDSVVMLQLFVQAKFNIGVAHCNFSLRGAEADADEAFVKKLAQQNKLSFFSTRFDTKKYATDNGISTQVAARDLRYAWFDKLLKNEGFDFVATAHHLNDAFETVLYNLTKGTGIEGLMGIAPKNDKVVRPLLFASRKEIENWADENKVTWREDASNASNDYSRNLIRNRVVPELEKINPSLVETFKNTQSRLKSTAQVVDHAVSQFKKDHTTQHNLDVIISRSGFATSELAVVDAFLKKYGFNIDQTKDILSTATREQSGKVFKSSDFQLNIDRNNLILSPLDSLEADNGIIETDQQVFTNRLFELRISQDKAEDSNINKYAAIIDLKKLKFPLTVRKWQEGDSFQPLGMKGKKKLSDFMIDSKIPLNLKERVYVLESDGEIAWVIGQRLDERFKVTKDTTQVLNFLLTYHD